MFYVFADGNSIYNPLDDSLAIFSPKVTLELGKSGSFQFNIPSTNEYYGYLEQLRTKIVVELDNTEIFRGRILSIKRDFNNIKSVYCEGILSYLVDSVQKANRFNGKAEDLYEKIIKRHNKMVEKEKRFDLDLGTFDVENATVVIPGKKEDDDEYYGEKKYEQAIIESIVNEWKTTYDYINTMFISYLGGYLIAKYDKAEKKNYIDYISNETFDNKVLIAMDSSIVDHEIEFGVNMLDFSEDVNAENMFTVLIPLGEGEDDVLTIASATNKYSNSEIELVEINGKQIGIADKKARSKYGSIIQTHSFDNVSNANTLFTDGVKYLKLHKNLPVSYTIKAVDLHFVNGTSGQIEIGDTVKITSTPHNVNRFLLCTRIEYDLVNPANTAYTFGNPEQSLTERYKKNKDKDKNDSETGDRSSAKGGGRAAGAAKDDAIYYSYETFAPALDWVQSHGVYAEYAISWYDAYAAGAVRAYAWVTGYGAGAERSINWYNQYSSGAIRAIDWVNGYGAAAEKSINWYDAYAAGAIRAYDWVTGYGAGAEKSINWYDMYSSGAIKAIDWVNGYGAGAGKTIDWYNAYAAGAIKSIAWINSYGANTERSIKWYNQYASGAIRAIDWVNGYGAGAERSIKWYNTYAAGAIRAYQWVNGYGAYSENSINWYNAYAAGAINAVQWVNGYGAKSVNTINWYNTYARGAVTAYQWVNSNGAGAVNAVNWYYNNNKAFTTISQTVNKNSSKISLIASFNDVNGKIEISAFNDTAVKKIKSKLALSGDDITINANDNISLAAKNVAIDAVFNATSAATFKRSVTFNGQGIFKDGFSVQGSDVAFGSGVDLNMGTNTINCGNINVESTYTIKIGGKEVALKKDVDDGLDKKLNSSDLTKTKIESLLKGNSFNSIGAYFRDAIGCKSDGGVTDLATFVKNQITNKVTGTFIKGLLAGSASEWGNYLRKSIGCTSSGAVVTLKDYVKEHSVTKSHSHDFKFGHVHSYSYKDGSETKTADTKGASVYKGTTDSAGA